MINPTGLASLAQQARWTGMRTQQRGGSARRRPSHVAWLTCREWLWTTVDDSGPLGISKPSFHI